MLEERFAIGSSFIHRLDPRIRLVSVFGYSIVVALLSSFQALIVAVFASLFLVLLPQLDAREIVKRMLIVNSFNLLLWLVLPLTFQGYPVLTTGPLTLYLSGILLAGQITLKSNAILMALIALLATMSFSTLGNALHWLRVPHKIVNLLLVTYRYIFLLEQEYERLIRAARIRAFRPSSNLHSYRTYAYIVGMLFIRSFMRAERVYNAMLCRGFKHRFHYLYEFETGKPEWLFGSAMAGLMVILIYLDGWAP